MNEKVGIMPLNSCPFGGHSGTTTRQRNYLCFNNLQGYLEYWNTKYTFAVSKAKQLNNLFTRLWQL